jgi:UDP-3-O-[3-hydroxymyristoyl] glucosamine N-acyltransferase
LNPKFDEKLKRWPAGISEHASIHPSAKIGKNVNIAPFVVIGENVTIGDGTNIGPNCVIEKNAQIGSKTYLHALVFIGANCEVGSECEIHPHTSIGSDGFGFATDSNNINHKIPQLGKVVIEDRVEIGSNVAIDRATLTETRICAGAKLDNLIHIAHNCTVGPNSLLAAGFATAGSSKLGANFKCGGKVGMDHHITVADNVTVGGNSVISKNLTHAGSYVGFPIQPWREGLRTIASLTSVPEMRKELAELKKEIERLKNR